MSLYYNGMYLGKIEPNEYTVKELQAAGFTVIVEQKTGATTGSGKSRNIISYMERFCQVKNCIILNKNFYPILCNFSVDKLVLI